MAFGGFRLRTLNFSAFGWRLSLRFVGHSAVVFLNGDFPAFGWGLSLRFAVHQLCGYMRHDFSAFGGGGERETFIKAPRASSSHPQCMHSPPGRGLSLREVALFIFATGQEFPRFGWGLSLRLRGSGAFEWCP